MLKGETYQEDRNTRGFPNNRSECYIKRLRGRKEICDGKNAMNSSRGREACFFFCAFLSLCAEQRRGSSDWFVVPRSRAASFQERRRRAREEAEINLSGWERAPRGARPFCFQFLTVQWRSRCCCFFFFFVVPCYGWNKGNTPDLFARRAGTRDDSWSGVSGRIVVTRTRARASRCLSSIIR